MDGFKTDSDATRRLKRSIEVLVANLNRYCGESTELAFRYTSNFWDKLNRKYSGVSYDDKMTLLRRYKSAIQKREYRAIYQVLMYFLAKRVSEKEAMDNLPQRSETELAYFVPFKSIDEVLFENSNIKVNNAEFA